MSKLTPWSQKTPEYFHRFLSLTAVTVDLSGQNYFVYNSLSQFIKVISWVFPNLTVYLLGDTKLSASWSRANFCHPWHSMTACHHLWRIIFFTTFVRCFAKQQGRCYLPALNSEKWCRCYLPALNSGKWCRCYLPELNSGKWWNLNCRIHPEECVSLPFYLEILWCNHTSENKGMFPDKKPS